MKKKIFAIISAIAIISTIFASCSSSQNKQLTSTTVDNYADNVNEYIIEEKEVTDANGKPVLDENGEKVTEQVLVNISGNNSNGSSAGSDSIVEIGNLTTKPEKITETTTMKKGENTTQSELTTIPADKNYVPLTTDTGKKVDFSSNDQQIIKQMLEVPYLYESSYENADGVPINIASHAAIWYLQRTGLSNNSFPEGDVVLPLFKYFGQTVVNYSNRCNNESSNKNIVFVSEKDANGNIINKMFFITNVEEKTHNITIDHIEDLGGNNYYKVVAKVNGIGDNAKDINTLNAIVQRNKLDSSLGFSIKALNWA